MMIIFINILLIIGQVNTDITQAEHRIYSNTSRPLLSSQYSDYCSSLFVKHNSILFNMSRSQILYTRNQLLDLNSKSHKIPFDTFTLLKHNDLLNRSRLTKRGSRGGNKITEAQFRPGENVSVPEISIPIEHKQNIGKNVGVSPSVNKSIEISLINARSIRNKAVPVCDYIIEHDIDILVITETWLTDSDAVVVSEVVPPDYHYILQNRTSGTGGGIMIIYKNCLNLQKQNVTSYSSFEILIAKFHINNALHRLACLYRPPPSKRNKLTNDLFLKEFQDFVVDTSLMAGHFLLLGDFNIHMDKPSDPLVSKFTTILEASNLTQHVAESTHDAGHILDLVISPTYDQNVESVRVEGAHFSDHNCILLTLKVNKPVRAKKVISYRKTKNLNIDSIKSAIVSSDLCAKVENEKDVESKLHAFNSILGDIFDKEAPLQTRNITLRPGCRWYNDDIRKAKHERRSAERKWRKTKLTVHKQIYDAVKQKTNKLITNSKKRYIRDKIFESKNNTTELFKIVKQITTPNCDKKLPSNPNHEELADTFSTFFKTKIENIRTTLDNPSPPCEPEEPQYNDTESTDPSCRPCTPLSAFSPSSNSEILKLIRTMPNKTCILDKVPTWLIKQCAEELSPAVTSIVNASLANADFPAIMKQAVVSPLLKKPSLDNEVLKNYRPVSNLNFISKLIEKIVANRLVSYLDENQLNLKYQSAYKSKHSTESAILRIHNDIIQYIDSGSSVILVLLDLSAAFDTIDQDILLERLHNTFNIDGNALAWFSQYIHDRSQRVIIDKNQSSDTKLDCGVPQGSVLGPILFSLYTAPLSDILRKHGVHYHLYADDTQIYLPIKMSSEEENIAKIEKCVAEIKHWMTANKLKLNEDKTEILTIGTKNNLNKINSSSLNIAGSQVQITSSHSIRNLGVYFDSTFSMSDHITKTSQSIHFHLKTIGKIRDVIDKDTAKLLVNSFITSKLDYCNSFLSGVPSCQLSRLQKLQNKAARLVSRTKLSDHITPVLHELH